MKLKDPDYDATSDYFAQRSESFGHTSILKVDADGITLHQYDCVPGGWEHEAIGSCRIAVQDTGRPRVERKMRGCSDHQYRPAGLVSISPPDCAQRWSWDCPMRMTLLFIKTDILDELAFENQSGCKIALQTPLAQDDRVISSVIHSLTNDLQENSLNPSVLMGTAGRFLGAYLLSRYNRSNFLLKRGQRVPNWRLRRILDFIDENLDRDIGLTEMASIADMTPHYFCRAFRMTLGVPPYKYLIARRVERAKQILEGTDKTLTEIALELGFSSHAHFSASFKRIVGSSPGSYRKSFVR